MTPLELDEYLDHNDVEINDETLSIAHHGILGMKHGQRNGPPYPLGRGDHSASEKKAASKAGIKVGSDSGKGSIENIKKSGASASAKKASRPETPEEHEAKRQAAIKSGSRVQVKKYAKEMSQDELREAMNRIDTMDKLKKKPDGTKNLSPKEREKKEALESGDLSRIQSVATLASKDELQTALDKADLISKNLSPKERETREALESGDYGRIRSVATLATKKELETALDKADLMAKLNYSLREPTAVDKIQKAVDTARLINGWAKTGADVWNTIAGYSNAFAGTDFQKINYTSVDIKGGSGDKKKKDDKK